MSSPERLDGRLFVAVSLLIVVVVAILFLNLHFQHRAYSEALGSLDRTSEIFPASALSFARAMDFAFTKTSVILLGFVVVMVGALYLLRSAKASLELEGRALGGMSLTLQSSSPGLVLVTLGLVTVVLALYARNLISLDYPALTEQKTESPAIAAEIAPGTSSLGNSSEHKDDDLFVSFPRGSTVLPETAKTKLTLLAQKLSRQPNTTVVLEGIVATDEGTDDATAIALSERRAQVVQVFLNGALRLSDRIKTTSYGESRPTQAQKSGVRLHFQEPPS